MADGSRSVAVRQGCPRHTGAQHPEIAVQPPLSSTRGDQITKIHALTDVLGRLYALALTPGNVSDITAADHFAKRLGRARNLIADMGYDADGLRKLRRANRTLPIIPGRSNRKRKVRYDKGGTRSAI